MTEVLIAALYKFVPLEDYQELRPRLEARCQELGIRGILLLASEGINGTIAGAPDALKAMLDFLRSDPRLADLVHKESRATEMPFRRLKVRLKKEIVTMGVDGIDPTSCVGTYVKPADWNALISDPDVVLVDTRNDYEVEIGTFKGAIDPRTTSFREFPEWSQQAPELKGKTRVAMFCTGGIRCEKASSYLLQQGVEEVYHLEGGILKYLEEIPKEESFWEGECFVFDERIAVDHDLKRGTHIMCFGCRRPVSEAGRASERYVEGVSCPACYDTLTDDQRERFGERHRQIMLAASRHAQHLGPAHTLESDETLAKRARPVLYSFRRCPYAIRARMALAAIDLQVELREVVLRNKPEHFLTISPKGTVPVLWLQDDSVIEESLEIIDWALAQQKDHPWADAPAGDGPYLEALITENDGAFKKNLDRFKYADRYDDADPVAHRTAAEVFLKKLETRLSHHPFLQGGRFGRADAAILPFIRQFSNIDRDWFAQTSYPRLKAWLSDGLERPIFLRVMSKYHPWESGSSGVLFPPAPAEALTESNAQCSA